jgi:hypothetical protein
MPNSNHPNLNSNHPNPNSNQLLHESLQPSIQITANASDFLGSAFFACHWSWAAT